MKGRQVAQHMLLLLEAQVRVHEKPALRHCGPSIDLPHDRAVLVGVVQALLLFFIGIQRLLAQALLVLALEAHRAPGHIALAEVCRLAVGRGWG